MTDVPADPDRLVVLRIVAIALCVLNMLLWISVEVTSVTLELAHTDDRLTTVIAFTLTPLFFVTTMSAGIMALTGTFVRVAFALSLVFPASVGLLVAAVMP